MTRLLPLAFVLALVSGCGDDAPPPTAAPPASTVKPVAQYQREDWALPVSVAAAQPDLIRAPDGSLLLSWIEPQDKAHALKLARYVGGHWNDVREVARGDDWFVNWADTPHITQTADGALWVHWLRKSAQAKYAYDVVLSRSTDDGTTWSKPMPVNDDGTPTEHGFVSLWPAAHDRLGVAWLDGRNSAGGHDGHGGHASAGTGHAMAAMTLRTAVFDATLQRHGERERDAMTCDCCQTDVALTADGPLLVYRDRTPEEIRDIVAMRLDDASTARRVHADEWKMPACPVNGPAVAARDREVLVGWYTAPAGEPQLKLARSTDSGDHFAAPLELDRGQHVQGRMDAALDADAVWVLWLREDAQGQSLWLARFAPDLSRELQRHEVAKLQGRGRGTGFARLALVDGVAHVVWTDVIDQRPRLSGARFGKSP